MCYDIPMNGGGNVDTVSEKKALGQRLQKLRINSGLTQKQVASKLGVTVSSYQFYERGERCPSFLLMCRIADVIGVNVESFRDNTNQCPNA